MTDHDNCSVWEVSDPAVCPTQSPHCGSLERLSCSFQGCSSSSLPAAQERVSHSGLADRFITGATVTASCSNKGEEYTVLETYSDPSLVLSLASLASPLYRPQYPPPTPWCLHPDCEPVRGVPWLAKNIAGPDCVEEEGGAWCLGDPALLLWKDGQFRLHDKSYETRNVSVEDIVSEHLSRPDKEAWRALKADEVKFGVQPLDGNWETEDFKTGAYFVLNLGNKSSFDKIKLRNLRWALRSTKEFRLLEELIIDKCENMSIYSACSYPTTQTQNQLTGSLFSLDL